MGWEEVRAELVGDGMTVDIYVLETRLEDWDRFLGFLWEAEGELEGWWPADRPSHPPRAESLIDAEEGRSLLVTIGHTTWSCFFFSPEEIELSIASDGIPSRSEMQPVLRFMSDLAGALGTEVRLCPENAPDAPIFAARADGSLTETDR